MVYGPDKTDVAKGNHVITSESGDVYCNYYQNSPGTYSPDTRSATKTFYSHRLQTTSALVTNSRTIDTTAGTYVNYDTTTGITHIGNQRGVNTGGINLSLYNSSGALVTPGLVVNSAETILGNRLRTTPIGTAGNMAAIYTSTVGSGTGYFFNDTGLTGFGDGTTSFLTKTYVLAAASGLIVANLGSTNFENGWNQLANTTDARYMFGFDTYNNLRSEIHLGRSTATHVVDSWYEDITVSDDEDWDLRREVTRIAPSLLQWKGTMNWQWLSAGKFVIGAVADASHRFAVTDGDVQIGSTTTPRNIHMGVGLRSAIRPSTTTTNDKIEIYTNNQLVTSFNYDTADSFGWQYLPGKFSVGTTSKTCTANIYGDIRFTSLTNGDGVSYFGNDKTTGNFYLRSGIPSDYFDRFFIASDGNIVIGGSTVIGTARFSVNGKIATSSASLNSICVNSTDPTNTTYSAFRLQNVNESPDGSSIIHFQSSWVSAYSCQQPNSMLLSNYIGNMNFQINRGMNFTWYETNAGVTSEVMKVTTAATSTYYLTHLADGTVQAINGTGQLSTASDVRLKENIETVSDSNILSKFSNIEVAKYNWKDRPTDGRKTLGIIAQQVEQYLPDCIDGKKYEYHIMRDEKGNPVLDTNGEVVLDTTKPRYRGYDHGAMIAYLILAIKQLTSDNETLRGALSTSSTEAANLRLDLTIAQERIDTLMTQMTEVQNYMAANQ